MKFAPPREDGLKPWVADIYEWGRQRQSIVWASSASEARARAVNRMRYTTAKVRRATPDDVARAT